MTTKNNTKSTLSWSKISMLSLLYMVQGLPFGFFLFTFPLHLRGQGLSLGKITFLSIVNMPWLLKFLWAPLVDKYWFSSMGRRKSWILPAQAGLVLSLVLTGILSSSLSLVGFMVLLTVVNFFAATQDIAVDGFAIDILSDNERGLGNSVQAAAFKIGMLGGGFGLTFFLFKYGVESCFFVMAGVVAIVMAAPFLVKENTASKKESESQKILPIIWEMFSRKGAIYFMLFIVFVKAGDALANPLFRLFLWDRGVGVAQINWIMNMGGIGATLFGSAICGFFIIKMGRKTTLIISVLGQGFSHFAWGIMAKYGITTVSAWGVALVEHFVSGMLTVVVFTIMMDSVNPKVGGSQYTILMSIHMAVVFFLGITAGYGAQYLGYGAIYLIGGTLTITSGILIKKMSTHGYLSGKRLEN
jgi:MFS transporter, PAT family, beta-lactamase induction signal transducer AmpG